MRSLSAASRGAITAEWALALPAVILVASVVFAGIGVLLERARLDQAAADIVRLVGLGVTEQVALARAERVFGGSLSASFDIDPPNHRVCVHLHSDGASGAKFLSMGVTAEGRACGLYVGSP